MEMTRSEPVASGDAHWWFREQVAPLRAGCLLWGTLLCMAGGSSLPVFFFFSLARLSAARNVGTSSERVAPRKPTAHSRWELLRRRTLDAGGLAQSVSFQSGSASRFP